MANPSTRASVILGLKDNVTPRLKRLSGGLDRVAVKAQRAGLAMGVGAAGLGMVMKKTVGAAVELDDNMRKVQARAGNMDTTKLSMLREEAKRLGRETSFTTGEVSELMATLAQAGLSGDQIDAQTENMLAFARANGLATDAAAEFAFQAGLAFGIDKGDTAGIEHVTDVMTYAATNSFQSVEDIGEAFKMVAPVAKATGQSIEDVGASLAIMANMGIKGSNAGRQMKNVLLKVGESGSDVAKTLGVEVRNSQGDMKKLPELLADFYDATADMGNVDAMKLFNKAFGKIGLNAAMIGGQGAENIRKMAREMGGLGGFTQKTSDLMDAGIGGALRRLMSAVDGIVIAIGESMVPIIDGLAKVFSFLLNVVTPIIANFKWLGAIIMSAFGVLAGGAATLLTIAGVFTIASAAVSALSFVFGTLASILSAVAVPVGIVGVVIAALVATVGAAVLMFVDLGQVSAGLGKLWASITETANNLFETVSSGFKGIQDAMKAGNMDLVWDIILQTMKVAFLQFMDFFGDTWRDKVKWAVDTLYGFANGFNELWATIIDGLTSAIIGLLDLLGLIDDRMADGMRKEMKNIRREKREAAQAKIDSIKASIDGVVGSSTDAEVAKLNEMLELAEKAREKVDEAEAAKQDQKKKPWWVQAAEDAKTAAQNAANAASEWYNKTFEEVEVKTKTTHGSMGAFSAAGLASKLNKDMYQVAKDQLTEVKTTNQILLKNRKKGVWVN